MCWLSGDRAGDRDDIGGGGVDTVSLEVLLNCEVSLGPFAGGCIRAKNQHGDGGGCDDDEWNNEGDSPCDVGC